MAAPYTVPWHIKALNHAFNLTDFARKIPRPAVRTPRPPMRKPVKHCNYRAAARFPMADKDA